MLVPDDFFDKDVETDKQFLDFANAIIDKEGGEGLEHVTSWKVKAAKFFWYQESLPEHQSNSEIGILYYLFFTGWRRDMGGFRGRRAQTF